MSFNQIQLKLGTKPVVKTWITNKEIAIYYVDYCFDGLTYKFLSYEEDGFASELDIYKN